MKKKKKNNEMILGTPPGKGHIQFGLPREKGTVETWKKRKQNRMEGIAEKKKYPDLAPSTSPE